MDFTTVILIVFVIVALTGLVLWVIFKNRDKSQKGNKEDIESKQIQLLVGLAGDGHLKDDSECSSEIKEYFSYISVDLLAKYINQCLEKAFKDSGFVLQDLINELGRRLDFNVENGTTYHYSITPENVVGEGPQLTPVIAEAIWNDSDQNGDGLVDVLDFVLLSNEWLWEAPWHTP
ncbi:hypothetical protein IIB50_02420 [Patescibacteria group bacterium]|nr:hypothetical protein [Patescibacteria group bacterium]